MERHLNRDHRRLIETGERSNRPHMSLPRTTRHPGTTQGRLADLLDRKQQVQRKRGMTTATS
jgi:hypothetical protein